MEEMGEQELKTYLQKEDEESEKQLAMLKDNLNAMKLKNESKSIDELISVLTDKDLANITKHTYVGAF